MRTRRALIVATPGFKFIAPNHKNWAPRLGFAYRINEKTVFRGGGGHLLQPEPDQQLHVPEHESAVESHFSMQLVARDFRPLSLSNPLAVPAACPLPGSNSGALIVTPPWDQPTGRMNQWSAGLERQLWNGGGLEVQYLGSHCLSSGPQLLQQHAAASRTRRRQLAPAESVVRPHPHHRQRRNRQLREHERHFPPAHDAGLQTLVQLHLGAYAGCHYRLQWRRHADESILGGKPTTATPTGTSATAWSPPSSTTSRSSRSRTRS